MILYQPYPNNYPFTLTTRIDEINTHQEDIIFKALSIHSQFLHLPFHFDSLLQEIYQLQLAIEKQEGFSPLAFPYLKSIIEKQRLNKNSQAMLLNDFLKQNHYFYPMNLKRENGVTIHDIQDEVYISCIYVLNHQKELIVAPFNSQIINNVWFDRNTHADLLYNQKALAAGVMYFDKYNKNLLFINNASGHYRVNLKFSMSHMKTILNSMFDINLINVANWSDVEFKNNIRLNCF